MGGRIKYITRAAVLLFYALYAVSPIYMSSAIGGEEKCFERACSARNVTIGIVWLKVLASSFLDDDQDDDNDVLAQVFAGSQDSGLILIKKKHVLFREQFAVEPHLETDVLPRSASEDHAASPREFEMPKEPRYQETDGYLSLNTGLSPPALLS